MNSLSTTDIFRSAYYLCMGGDLSGIEFDREYKGTALFLITGRDLLKLDHDYASGKALVNPVQLRESLNFLRDALFARLRSHTPASSLTAPKRQREGREKNDRTNTNRGHQRNRGA